MCHILGNYELTFAPGWYERVEKTNGIIRVDDDPAPLYGSYIFLSSRKESDRGSMGRRSFLESSYEESFYGCRFFQGLKQP